MEDRFTPTGLFSGYLSELGNKDEVQRAQAARYLSQFVITDMTYMSSELAKPYEDMISKRLHELVHTKVPEDESGGLTAIGFLLEAPLGETNELKRLYRYFNYASVPLASSDINVTLAASKVLGRILKIGGISFGETFVDSQTGSQLNAIVYEEKRRFGAVLLLKELARHLPAWFAPHIALVLERLSIGFRDTRV